MTFVAAKRFGERVLIASDTMISDPTKMRPDMIPGRLKVIVLNGQITIAYAGLSDQSVDTIKLVKQLLDCGGSLSDAEQTLVSATQRYAGQLEFLIVSHREGLTLKRIWDGRISSNLDQACIGQRDLLTVLLKLENEAPRSIIPHEFEEEAPFMFAFITLFNGVQVSDNVGGFGISAVCSPFGHCYATSAGTATWGISGQVDADQRSANRLSGMTQWGYNIAATKLRGVGVIGAAVLDAGIGYIYSPLQNDEPLEWRFQKPAEFKQHGTILSEFQKKLDNIALAVGGGIEVISPPPFNRMPSTSEFEKIVAHATAAALSTHVSIEPEAVNIRCEAGNENRTIRIGLTSLGDDPTRILRIAIDRLNNEIMARLHRMGTK